MKPSLPIKDLTEIKIFRGLLLFGFVLGIGIFFYTARAIILPFLLAGLMAYLLNPFVSFLEMRGFSRLFSIISLYALFLLAFFVVAYWGLIIFWEDLPTLRYEWPLYMEKLKNMSVHYAPLLEEEWPWLFDLGIIQKMGEYLLDWAHKSFQQVPIYLSSVLYGGFNLVLVPFVGFFILKESRQGFQSLLNFCPGRWIEKFLSLVHQVDEILGSYIRGVLFEALLVGGLSAIGLMALGIDYAGLIGIIVGLFNLIPYLGPLVGGVVGVGVSFLQFQNFHEPVYVFVLFLIIQLIDNWIFQPFILKRAVNLHPVVILFALLCGGELGGFLGLLLAVPIVSILKEAFQIVFGWYISENGIRPYSKNLEELLAKAWVV